MTRACVSGCHRKFLLKHNYVGRLTPSHKLRALGARGNCSCSAQAKLKLRTELFRHLVTRAEPLVPECLRRSLGSSSFPPPPPFFSTLRRPAWRFWQFSAFFAFSRALGSPFSGLCHGFSRIVCLFRLAFLRFPAFSRLSCGFLGLSLFAISFLATRPKCPAAARRRRCKRLSLLQFRLFRFRELAGKGCSASEPHRCTRLGGQKR